MKLRRAIHDFRTQLRNACRIRSKPILYTDYSSASILKEGFTEKISNDWEYSVGFSKDPFINITHPSAAYLEVNNAYLTGDRAYLFLDKNRYIDDFSEGPHINKSKIRHPISWLSETLDGTVFHLSGPNHENHGHFITQFLPRLLLMKDLLDKNPSIKILIAPGHKTWQSKYLEILGINPDRCVSCLTGTIKSEKVIYVPFFHGSNHLVEGKYYRELRKYFSPKPISKKYKAIFLTRENAPDKSIINEPEVIAKIEKILGESVHKVELASLTLNQQIDLSNSAEYIIGATGQALTIQLFSYDSKVVILDSLEPKNHRWGWSASFRDLGIHLGHSAIRLNAQASSKSNRDWGYPIDTFTEQFTKAINVF